MACEHARLVVLAQPEPRRPLRLAAPLVEPPWSAAGAMTVLLCETPNGCTCGAPSTTPRGMHHDDCGIRNPSGVPE